MKQELADITIDEKKELRGFKILGVFPFYLKYIKTGTHIQLCKIKEQLQALLEGNEPSINDFNNAKLQENLMPLINRYVVTALLNNRSFSWFFRMFLKRKIKTCSHYHILNLYLTIHKLNEPAFFLSYWRLITQKDHTLLKEGGQSLEKSSVTKNERE